MINSIESLHHIKCPIHRETIKFIDLQPNTEREKRALCEKCSYQEVETISIVEQKWIEIQNKEATQINQTTEDSIKDLHHIIIQCETFRNSIISIVNELISQIKQSIITFKSVGDQQKKSIEDQSKNLQFENLLDIAEMLSLENHQSKFTYFKQAYSQIVEALFEHLKDSSSFTEQVKYQTDLLKYNTQLILQQQQSLIDTRYDVQSSSTISYQLVNDIQHREQCRAIAFYRDNLMITGFGNYIKVWEFDSGNVYEKDKLFGHSNTVNCLTFGQTPDLFVSGSSDQTIKIWKKNSQSQWIYLNLGRIHCHFVVGVLFHNESQQIISCSHDSTIKIWNHEVDNGTWIYYQSLDNHKDAVHCISFNQSQTQFVSCGQDGRIIIWGMEGNNCWGIRQEIKKQEFGYRLCFIQDEQIAWQQKLKGVTAVYQLDNDDGLFKEQDNLKILLRDGSQDSWLFPTIFNNQKQIIIQKHNKWVYILAKRDDYQFSVVQIIEMSHHDVFGSITEDGQYLSVWDSQSRTIKIFEITYQY